ncbi:hypothetical protein [Amycolatopsis sp. 195334CR]|uniref:hypothetical protein n=1 Tax=Amycolatopsis sp. 195334CR TaxID=2814588 RepID=UPI001A8D6D58|nr:hypothetical protein [Amycolatopsis sp. 195334CR]MBN6039438.1 hypothetical protein [Amycolatopsis sp. 195334CR]
MIASRGAAAMDTGETAQSPLACPQCREVDQVQHVPAVHQGGRVSYQGLGPAYTGTTGYATPYHGVATSAVSSALNPAPPIRGASGYLVLAVLATIFTGLAGIVALSLTVASEHISVIGQFWTWIWPALGLGMSVLGFLQYAHRSRANTQMRQGSQRVLDVWSRAWFCHRCGMVFFPETDQVIPLHAFRAYLWQIGDYRV